MRVRARGVAALLLLSVAFGPATAGEVAKQGQSSTIKLQHVVAGHLVALNGKYELRVTEVRYVPGGFIGEHHHAGPGVRCLTAGDLTYVQPDRTTVYHPGDCFFESGDVSHTAENKGHAAVVLLNFEVLPLAWSGSSAVPVPEK